MRGGYCDLHRKGFYGASCPSCKTGATMSEFKELKPSMSEIAKAVMEINPNGRLAGAAITDIEKLVVWAIEWNTRPTEQSDKVDCYWVDGSGNTKNLRFWVNSQEDADRISDALGIASDSTEQSGGSELVERLKDLQTRLNDKFSPVIDDAIAALQSSAKPDGGELAEAKEGWPRTQELLERLKANNHDCVLSMSERHELEEDVYRLYGLIQSSRDGVVINENERRLLEQFEKWWSHVDYHCCVDNDLHESDLSTLIHKLTKQALGDSRNG